MNRFTYEIEQAEVTLPNGEKRLAYGTVDIEYSTHPAEPDVGIFSRYHEWEPCGPLVVYLTPVDDDETREMVTVGQFSELHAQIFDACEDSIYRQCQRDYAEAPYARAS